MQLRFLDCAMDLERQTFSVSGERRHLEPQVFALLAHLAQHPDTLVTRDELVETVWQGRIVSDAAIHARIAAARKAVGDDGRTQRVIETVSRRGLRFLAPVTRESASEAAKDAGLPAEGAAPQAAIRFCRSSDGTRIAWSASGEGTPIVRAGHWLTHLEHDRASPIWRPIIDAFCAFSSFVRYDGRGNGLSERAVADLSVEALASDLLAVADAAALDRFTLYATSQGVPVALAFAAAHPERVAGLILHGGFARGRGVRSADAKAVAQAYVTLMRQGWGAEGSQFLQAFASIFVPDGTVEQIRSLTELQRISADADMAVRLRQAFDAMDATHLLPQITAPTLVLHARNDGVHPLSEGLDLAAAIKGAELTVLESRNHVLVPHEPAWPVFFSAVRQFAQAVSP
ncbi:MAG: alpha/beta fold hydrolase [Pseudomonadota bacterium]